MNTWLKDPLLRIFVAALVVFVFYWWVNNESAPDPVILSDSGLDLLLSEYEALTGNAPDAAVRDAIVADYYRREVLFREGVARQIYLDSGVLREAIIKEMQQQVSGGLEEPTPAQLVDFYTKNIDRYYLEASITFEQYFRTTKPEDPQSLLNALGTDNPPPGDRSPIGEQFPAYGESMIRGLLGNDVLLGLQQATLGDWIGPVETQYGWHFFRVAERTEKQLQPFERVASQVLAEQQADALDARIDTFVGELNLRYPLQRPRVSVP